MSELMDQDKLIRLQKVETEILRDVDKFCRENDIKYSLMYGTLLGSVRHKGPIPWDDDIDIGMERNEYNKFIKLWKRRKPDGYYLQSEGKNSCSSINHTKIRKKGTLLCSKKELKLYAHNEIWIDVFPIDKIPKQKIKRALMLFAASLRIIYTRNYPYENGNLLLNMVSNIMLNIPPKIKFGIKNYCENYIQHYSGIEKKFNYVSLAAPYMLKQFFPNTIFDQYIEAEYDGYKFMAIADYDTFLKIRYGDYMSLPPAEEQVCKHNPEICVFETM